MSDDAAQRDFFERALEDAGQWVRFADRKALAALVILGLALSNLLYLATPLLDARETETFWGWVATISFGLAGVAAAVTVLNVIGALFPRVTPAGRTAAPLYFFAHVAAFDTPKDYEREVRGRTGRELESAVAAQTWEVARIAGLKHRHAKVALQGVLAFLACWAAARLGLSLSQ